MNIDRLNYIQSVWISLSSDSTTEEQQRVFKLMDEYPPSYITGKNGSFNIMHSGGFAEFASAQDLETVKTRAQLRNIPTDISWDCTGNWINI